MLLQNQRTARESSDLRALLETHWGLLCVQEHRGEMWIGDVDVVHSDAMKNQRNSRVSGDQEGLLETHWGHLSAQEHRGEMCICDVDVVHYDAMKNHRNLRVSCDHAGHFETSWCPRGSILEPSCGTGGAYPFDMCKKEESSATARKLGPTASCLGRGETLSKQVDLGWCYRAAAVRFRPASLRQCPSP